MINLVGIESEVHAICRDAEDPLTEGPAEQLLSGILRSYGMCQEDFAEVSNAAKEWRDIRELLPNGSRVYLDHGYVEYSTPECAYTTQAVAAVRAGDEILREVARDLRRLCPREAPIMAIRNNSDHCGHSYAAHVNIRTTRGGFERILSDARVLNEFVVPFFVTLPLLCGSGRCGSEDGDDVFQIWQRGDFVQELLGWQTTFDRPLVNTRDESLAADPDRYARFHVIAFDANRMEVAEFLKLGLLRLLCAAIDADRMDVALELDEPLAAVRQISRHPFKPLHLSSNKSITPAQIQREFLEAFSNLYKQRTFEGRVPDAGEILTQWNEVLTQLEEDPFGLVGKLDWISKYVWLEQIRVERNLRWSDPQLKWLDIQYHSLTEDPCCRLPCTRMTTDEQIRRLTREAPSGSRAAVRGELLRRFGREIAEADWPWIVSSDGETAYILPDDPAPDAISLLSDARTLKEAANLLGLPGVRLRSLEELTPSQGELPVTPSDQSIVSF